MELVSFSCTYIGKIPKARVKVVYRRSYKRFLNGHFVEDVSNVDWNDVYSANDPEVSLTAFMDIFIKIVNRYAPMKKSIAKSNIAQWTDLLYR